MNHKLKASLSAAPNSADVSPSLVIEAKYRHFGGESGLGRPNTINLEGPRKFEFSTTTLVELPDGSYYTSYQKKNVYSDQIVNSRIYWTSRHGAWLIQDPILGYWLGSLEIQGLLGYPTSDPVFSEINLPTGNVFQANHNDFETGAIYQIVGTGVLVQLHGAIFQTWNDLGREQFIPVPQSSQVPPQLNDYIGFPITDQLEWTDPVTNEIIAGQCNFQNGRLRFDKTDKKHRGQVWWEKSP